MQPHSSVLVDLDGATVPGLFLKASGDGSRLLVTFEQDGRVSTSWLPADRVRALGQEDPGRALAEDAP